MSTEQLNEALAASQAREETYRRDVVNLTAENVRMIHYADKLNKDLDSTRSDVKRLTTENFRRTQEQASMRAALDASRADVGRLTKELSEITSDFKLMCDVAKRGYERVVELKKLPPRESSRADVLEAEVLATRAHDAAKTPDEKEATWFKLAGARAATDMRNALDAGKFKEGG